MMIPNTETFKLIEDVPKHEGPNLVFADDDQQRSRPGRLAKHPAVNPAHSLVCVPAVRNIVQPKISNRHSKLDANMAKTLI